MTVGESGRRQIKKFVHEKLQKKLDGYAPITTLDNHFVLSGILPTKVRRQYSAVHSLSTSIGMSFYEQIAVLVAKTNSEVAERQWKSNIGVAQARQAKIGEIIREVGNGSRKPDIDSEMGEILSTPNTDLREVSAGRIVDLHIKRGKDEYYVDIKTSSPNKSGFLDHKRLLLTWIARADKRIRPVIAVPYNPYHPKPYKRLGSDAMQVGVDLLVGRDFWDLVGGDGFFDELVNLFREEGAWYWSRLEEKLDRFPD